MASKVKLLSAAAASTTGTAFKIGTGQQPYTILIRGGFGLGGGVAGTKGVHIETSDDNTNWFRDIGVMGGVNLTEATTGELTDLPDQTIAIIQHHASWIRAVTGSGMTGAATVEVEMGH